MVKPSTYRIPNWDARFEKAQTRKAPDAVWVAIPNSMDSADYCAIIAEGGPTLYAVWVIVLMIASRRVSVPGAAPDKDGKRQRVSTRDGSLLKGDGSPHTAESIALISRFPRDMIENGLARFWRMGLLEKISARKGLTKRRTTSGGTTPATSDTPTSLPPHGRVGTQGKEKELKVAEGRGPGRETEPPPAPRAIHTGGGYDREKSAREREEMARRVQEARR